MLDAAVPIYAVLAAAEASTNLARFDGLRYGRRVEVAGSVPGTVHASRGRGLGSEVRRRILLGTFVLSAGYRHAYYERALAARQRLGRAIARILDSADILVTPTTPGPAFELGSRLDDPVAMYRSDVLTVAANLAGLPAVSVPMGLHRAGDDDDPQQGRGELPLGLQLVAGAWQERLLLGLAAAYEQARGPLPGPLPGSAGAAA
jgi:aspartyl-tRNA(Asn)/glutamyl-tRNA(Gln) amidotransferase subunit A